jgi:sulfide:quinone oxidoreductase
MVVALGADLDPGATPGLVEAGNEFYTVEGAFALRDVLATFDGGRVIVGVTSTPFKCPPAPSETVLLMHDYLVARGCGTGRRSRSSCHLPVPIPPSPAASEALLEAFAQRDIGWYPQSTDTGARSDGQGGPVRRRHRNALRPVPRRPDPSRACRVAESGMTVEGWIPVNPLTLETSHPGCSPSETSPASARRRPASSPSDRRRWRPIASSRYSEAAPAPRSTTAPAVCYLEFGDDQVARVDVTFAAGHAPTGTYKGPSEELAAEKAEFGASRIWRWFDRAWTTLPEPR